MDQPACKLTLIYPVDAEDQIVELLLGCDPPLPGFTTWIADGHGQGFAHAGTAERVRGRVKRGVLMTVIPRTGLPKLLDLIREKIAIPGLAHWVEPVDSCGRLG